MKRIYFLAPNIEITHKIVEDLHAEGVDDSHIHVLAKPDTPLEGLPEAGINIRTDFIAALERGVALGGVSGLVAGLVGLRFAGFVIAGGPILGAIMAGATIGTLAGGLLGLGGGNSKLRRFEHDIEQGKLLVLADIPKERIENARQMIVKHLPEAEFEGVEPILPPSY